MAQIKLELEKEVCVPYKVIIKMEEEESTKYAWQEDDEYHYGQHWKTKGY